MQANVTKVTQSTHLNQHGKAETVFHVQFVVGDHGPFTESFAKPEFTEPEVKARLKTIADTILQIHQPGQA